MVLIPALKVRLSSSSVCAIIHVDGVDDDGGTALQVAKRRRRQDIVKMFERRGIVE